MDTNQQTELEQYFLSLPEPVQQAISSIDIQAKMRTLSQKHQLHFDKWQALEDSVMLTVLGIIPGADLLTRIQTDTSLESDAAESLLEDISQEIFSPLHEEIERLTGSPDAEEVEKTPLDILTHEAVMLEKAQQSDSNHLLPPAPTPPPQNQTEKATRLDPPPHLENSSVRKSVQNDPYREQV